MAAATLTERPRRHTLSDQPKPRRRSSASEWLNSLRRTSKARSASATHAERRAVSPPMSPPMSPRATVIDEEEAEEAVDDVAPLQRSDTWQKRLSKRMSVVTWNPDWNIQGAIPSVQEGVTGTFQAIRRMSRTEPSHETNFPPSGQFPEEGGLKVTMPIYGMIDALDEHSMRLLLLQGVRTTFVPDEEKGKGRQRKPFELPASQLKNGDWLCNPPSGPYASDSSMAMVLRGEIQGFDVKCRIVGMFPIKAFGEPLPETYEMDVVIF